tara:strand:- start:330 stop:1031 length:702 start_codon:yes stop_codon:yes gene_type:complete
MRQIVAFLVVLVLGISIAVYVISDAQSNKKNGASNVKNKPSCFISVSANSQYELPIDDDELCNNHEITDFRLINQNGDSVDLNLLKNKVCIVDFFFVSCGSICPKMNQQLKRVHDHFLNNDRVMLLSHTVWPEMDTPEVLYDYAESYGANHLKWQFLTGDKKELYRMARYNYLVVPDVDDPGFDHGGEADFIHTENVVLIDANKKIRGFYDGVSSTDIDRLMDDVDQLLSESR